MAQDLTVTADRPVVLSEADPKAFREAFQVLRLNSFGELSKLGLVDSPRALSSMLAAAKAVTARSMTKSGADGSWSDAERFANFRGSIRGVAPSQASIFWSVARSIPPKVLLEESTTADSRFRDPFTWQGFKFNDVTIKPGAVLTVAAKNFTCGRLVIEKTGKLKSVGSGLYIHATSITGK